MNTSVLVPAARMCFFNFGGIMRNNIFKPRYYQHIDKVINIKDVINKITNKEYIKKHSFYPFISYTIKFKKYSEIIDVDTNHHWKFKKRPIKYASHIDRCIYQWYSYRLSFYDGTDKRVKRKPHRAAFYKVFR